MKTSTKIACEQDNRVIIRVWTSGLNKKIQGENVGHVSIETTTPKGYMSLWPEGLPDGKKLVSIVEKRPSKYMASYQDDFNAEGRKPEIVICLYTLKAEEIVNCFNKTKQKNEGWTLLGNNTIHGKDAHSCATLAYDLLKTGGLYDLVSSSFSFSYSSTVAPDTLVLALIKAKKNELKQYPETKQFSLENEYDIQQSKPCIVM